MTATERDRLDAMEAKVDRILTILDDPDFGIRPTMRSSNKKIRALELKFYGILAGLIGAIGVFLVSIAGGAR